MAAATVAVADMNIVKDGDIPGSLSSAGVVAIIPDTA
jgi:hypothetical protein